MKKIIEWKLSEEEITRGLNCIKEKNYEECLNDYLGCLLIGELCVDFLLRDYGQGLALDYDIFVGGVDTGYGETLINKSSYDYADGGLLVNEKNIEEFSIYNFKELALKEIEDYIKNSTYNVKGYTLKNKANSKKIFNWA